MCAQVMEVFEEQFLNRLVATLKKEMRKLSPSDAVSSISIAKLAGEEGAFGGFTPGEGATAARKSEKARLQQIDAFCTTIIFIALSYFQQYPWSSLMSEAPILLHL